MTHLPPALAAADHDGRVAAVAEALALCPPVTAAEFAEQLAVRWPEVRLIHGAQSAADYLTMLYLAGVCTRSHRAGTGLLEYAIAGAAHV